MKDALLVFGAALKDTYYELFELALLNMLTVLLLLPVVTGPPALAALWAMGNRVAQGEPVNTRAYLNALRVHFGRAWAVTGLNLVAVGVVAANFWFYNPGNNPLGLSPHLSLYIQAGWVGMLVFWLLLSQYLFPLLLEQEDQRLRTGLRNAAVLLVTRPGFAVILLLLTTLVAMVSTFLTIPWMLITLSFLAVLANTAVRRLLEPHRA